LHEVIRSVSWANARVATTIAKRLLNPSREVVLDTI
jgi:hypothetical protein